MILTYLLSLRLCLDGILSLVSYTLIIIIFCMSYAKMVLQEVEWEWCIKITFHLRNTLNLKFIHILNILNAVLQLVKLFSTVCCVSTAPIRYKSTEALYILCRVDMCSPGLHKILSLGDINIHLIRILVR